MKENKTQSKQAKHNCAFFRLRDDGAAMKAKRTAKSIQPIPISAATSRLQVTEPWIPANTRLLEEAGESTNHKIPTTKLWWFVAFVACRTNSQKIRIAKPRLQSGGLPFLLEVAAEEDKTQSKQAKHKRVFLRLRDDPAVNAQSHSVSGKVRIRSREVVHIPANKIADRLVY